MNQVTWAEMTNSSHTGNLSKCTDSNTWATAAVGETLEINFKWDIYKAVKQTMLSKYSTQFFADNIGGIFFLVFPHCCWAERQTYPNHEIKLSSVVLQPNDKSICQNQRDKVLSSRGQGQGNIINMALKWCDLSSLAQTMYSLFWGQGWDWAVTRFTG